MLLSDINHQRQTAFGGGIPTWMTRGWLSGSRNKGASCTTVCRG